MRGRKPKPLALQIAEGDTRKRGVRKLAQAIKNEPKSGRPLGSAPVYLDPEEKAEYEVIRQAVSDLGLADGADDGVIALAAISCVAARTTRSSSALRTALGFLSSLGLGGPASRTRLATDKADADKKDLMEMLSTPRQPFAEKVQ